MAWDLRLDPPRRRRDGEDGGRRGGFRGPSGGPEVLPGTYTVRLTVDGEIYETPVDVGVDPLVTTSQAELTAQFEAARKIWEMTSTVNDILRGIDGVKAQSAARRRSAEQLKKELSDKLEATWKDFDEGLKEFHDTLARPEDVTFWSEGPRLSGRLPSLGRNVSSAFRAPSAAQIRLMGELEEELRAAVETWRTFLETKLTGLNTALSEAGIPTVAAPQAIE